MKIGYVRVNTLEQKTERQEAVLQDFGVDKIFMDKASGKTAKRPELSEMMDYVRDGDTVVVESISRFARSARYFLDLLERLAEKDVKFISKKESIDTGTPTGGVRVKKIPVIFSLLAGCLIMLSACERSEAEKYVKYEAETLLASEEPAAYEHKNLNNTGFLTPVASQVFLNGVEVSLPGYAIYDRNYFRMDDIAYMLRDTLARFNFWYWSTDENVTHILRGERAFSREGDRPAGEGEPQPTQMRISTSMPTYRGGTAPRELIAPVEAFATESHPYFALEDLAGFLGFTIDHAPGGAILLDTNEPNISEYGLRAAKDFLSLSPSLFPRPPIYEVAMAGSFMLHDLNGNGIPDIFIQYADRPEVHAIYMYFNGSYQLIGTVNLWNELLRDSQGRIFALCGSFHAYFRDHFTDVRMLTINEDGAEWSAISTAPNAFLANHYEALTSIRPLSRDMLNDISRAVVHRLAVPAESAPVTAQILLNGEPISLAGHSIEGRDYFRLTDIAHMLRNTRAHFYFTEHRTSLHGAHINIDRRGVSTVNATAARQQILYPMRAMLYIDLGLGSTHGDMWYDGVNTFGTEGATYFALEDLGGFLGFFLDHAADGSDTIIIDTNEPGISEYGRRAAEEFLMQWPAIFLPYPWSDEVLAAAEPRRMSDVLGRDEWHGYDAYVFPEGFMLHDLNGNGIPDIFLSYWFWDWPTAFVIYSYFEGEGYRRIGVVGKWGEMFRDRQGRVFFLEGAHQTHFAFMWTLTFIENDVEWDIMYLYHWPADVYVDERSELFWKNWHNSPYITPAAPDNLGEPLTSTGFLWDLTRCVAETVEQKLVD